MKDRPDVVPWRPKVGIDPKLSDAELVTLTAMRALLGFAHEARWLRHARVHLTHLFPYLPGQAGYNKRLRRSAEPLQAMIRLLAEDTDVWSDDTWLIDSTPVECSRSVPTTKRSPLAGWAGYEYIARPVLRRCWLLGEVDDRYAGVIHVNASKPTPASPRRPLIRRRRGSPLARLGAHRSS